ncbi:MAG: hypothetical protein ACFFBD_13800 [Candidatus Hodarchaeota archaeon]
MSSPLRNCSTFVLIVFILLYLRFNPNVLELCSSELEQTRVVFKVNEIFDLGIVQTLTYQFPLWLDWVGSHARIRIQGGIITGSIPSSLEIKAILGGIKSQQTFTKMNGFQKHYTFHSTSEYVLEVPPPVHPALEGIQTRHNLTVELDFTFSVSPEGTGLIKQIIFETFTPPTLDSLNTRLFVLIQNHFSWEIDMWSFGEYFFNTSLIIPFSEPQNASLQVNIEFSGLTLDGWIVYVKQGRTEMSIQNSQKLEGILELNPVLLCEVRLLIDPPQVSEPELISTSIKVRGTVLPSQEPSNSTESSEPEILHLTPKFFFAFLTGSIIGFAAALVIYPRYRKWRQKSFATQKEVVK